MVTAQDWLDAQIGVIGSVLIRPDLAAKVLAETTESDYYGQCLSIFRAIRELSRDGKPADPVMVRSKLGPEYTQAILDICEVTPTAANLDYYIEACKTKSQLLQLRDLGAKLQDADTLEDAMALLEQANKRSVQRTGVQIVTMEQAMLSFFDRHEQNVEYLPWPISGMGDKIYAESGDFIIIGGYPSDGKSAFSIQMALDLSKTKRVGFFSLETNPAKLHDRLMAHAAWIDMCRLKTNTMTSDDWESAGLVSSDVISRNLEYIPAAGKSVDEIRAISQARRYDVIFVDYLQLVAGRGKDRFSVVTDISIALHTMSQSTGITVIALSQMSRPDKIMVDEQGRKVGPGYKGKIKYMTPAPQLRDLRESGQIEQDADIVIMLYRPFEDSDQRTLLIRKNKEGELGSIVLSFDGRHQTFYRFGEKPNRPCQPTVQDNQSDGNDFEQLPMDTYTPFDARTTDGGRSDA